MRKDQTVVEMRGITKRFPGIVANDSISFQVKKGEIHALLGENGAGKSTLMNILFGLYEPDEGEILINEQKVDIKDPKKAIELGIGMIHQHFMLVEPYSVVQNIILGTEPTKGVTIDYAQAVRKVEELSAKYGLQVEPHQLIKDISVGMQQRVEILKTLYRGADILIFDEPTAVLTPQEIKELMEIMRSLVNEGKTIILITHKLKEIMAVCSGVTIIRRGKVIDSVTVKDTTPDELAAKMVGRKVSFSVEKQDANPSDSFLKLSNVQALDNRGILALKNLSFELKKGEILGIAGVEGNGQRELIEVITGLRRVESGEILIKDKPIHNLKPRQISESKVGYIPEDRHKTGLVLDFTVSENMVLKNYFYPEYNKNLFLNYDKINHHAVDLISEYDVRTPSETTPARALSGGNQQKVIIAREVDSDPDLLIATQPTRGLDVGAIEFIHKKLIEQRDKGKAVLLYSLELDEIMNLSDRIAVMYEGRIVGIVDPKKTSEQEIGLMMSGSKSGGEESA
ncbi:ABC transporter ATP-binding protein [Paenibacillus planticolens]|uniref:ATP-binding cassette domain-containing protein n=1 Tax=Paenibacillus planticolens TaxID=2654976 RepID=A0ABX1ZLS0_9BACL|nr:ABC transporter ATP-binding protein [Paenibacillus planticolens]NOU99826.1 ATP-binding cassette domain-containing protein [Paenibacillus planticolens]